MHVASVDNANPKKEILFNIDLLHRRHCAAGCTEVVFPHDGDSVTDICIANPEMQERITRDGAAPLNFKYDNSIVRGLQRLDEMLRHDFIGDPRLSDVCDGKG